MPALRIRFRAQLRSRWRAWLALSVVAGLLAGVVIGTAAAAKRTAGSYRRYLASINGADVYVDPFVSAHGDSLPLDPVAALPQVAHTERSLQLAIIVRSRKGRPVLPAGKDSVGWVLPTDERRLDTIDRLKLLRGRLPDPDTSERGDRRHEGAPHPRRRRGRQRRDTHDQGARRRRGNRPSDVRSRGEPAP
jgi:hypothetical protein